jgi:hypothetical protein
VVASDVMIYALGRSLLYKICIQKLMQRLELSCFKKYSKIVSPLFSIPRYYVRFIGVTVSCTDWTTRFWSNGQYNTNELSATVFTAIFAVNLL